MCEGCEGCEFPEAGAALTVVGGVELVKPHVWRVGLGRDTWAQGSVAFPAARPDLGGGGPDVFKSAEKPLLPGGGFWAAPKSLVQYLPGPCPLHVATQGRV